MLKAFLKPNPDKANALLLRAADFGDFKTVKNLLEKGHILYGKPDINAQDAGHQTALIKAAQEGALNVVQYLVKHGANINIQDSYRETALTAAAMQGNWDIVKYLSTQKGININAQNFNGSTVLILAARDSGDNQLIEHLVKHGADMSIQSTETTAFGAALFHKQYKTASTLIHLGFDINHKVKYSVKKATTYQDLSLSFNNVKALQFLIENNADINIADSSGRTILMEAIVYEKTEFITLLLENGANLNLQDAVGDTALIHAVKKRNLEYVKQLVEHGADLKIKNRDDQSALDYAITDPYPNETIIEYLKKVYKNPEQYQNIAINNFRQALEAISQTELKEIQFNLPLLKRIICTKQEDVILNRLNYEHQLPFYIAIRGMVTPEQKKRMEAIIRKKRQEKEKV